MTSNSSFVMPSRSEYIRYFGPRSCSLTAITIVSSLPKELVLQETVKVVPLSKIHRRGTMNEEVVQILRRLRVEFQEISRLKDPNCHPSFTGWTIHGMKEKEFKQRCDLSKTYLVRNRDHMWVIRNGISLDPVWYVENKQNARRVLTNVWEITE
jgi:hypothetical protein